MYLLEDRPYKPYSASARCLFSFIEARGHPFSRSAQPQLDHKMPTRSSARDTSSEERASGEEAAPTEKPSTENNALLAEDEVDDSDEDKPKKGGNQGIRKIDIEFIEVSFLSCA